MLFSYFLDGNFSMIIAKWNHKEEKVLVELMVEQVKNGNRPTTTFSTKAWTEIIDEFYRRTGNRYTKSQFVNKFNKLRLVYREFKKLHDIPTGFGWDPVTKTITAPNDVWDQYLKINPKAQNFRKKGCPMFDELGIIYGDTTARGENAGAPTQGAVDTDDEIVYPYDKGQDNHHGDGIATEVDDDAHFVGENHVRSRSKTPSRRRGSKLVTYFDQACTSFTDYYQQRLASSNKYVESEDAFSIKNCIALLSSISNVDKEIYLKA